MGEYQSESGKVWGLAIVPIQSIESDQLAHHGDSRTNKPDKHKDSVYPLLSPPNYATNASTGSPIG